MQKHGLTLVELLAVIVILVVVLAVSIPVIADIINGVKIEAFIDNSKAMVKSVRNYLAAGGINYPENIGDAIEVKLSDLQANNYIGAIKSPNDNSIECNGYVIVTKIGATDYNYTPHLDCINGVGSLLEDGLVSHWKFDDFQENSKNLIPNSPINTYPKIGNTHGTYNTNQYNGNTYFSIGTILNIENNIVTLSSVDHPIYTYDVLTPQTSGGGVTAGVNYFVKKQSATAFSLHQYNNSQDGSQGFKVHDSINNDVRINITSSGFPTMWYGVPHLPNSALVKEIVSNCFNGHECIRLYTNYKPEGSSDGMAYGVYPVVEKGKTYTFSFYYRASNQATIGKSISLNIYTGGYWPNSGATKTITSTDWQRYEVTSVAPNSGGVNLYFWPSKGSVTDITEIQCEEKPYATPFTVTERIDTVKDYSGNGNSATLQLSTTPKWVSTGKIGNGSYEFNGINSYIALPSNLSTVLNNSNFTLSAWIKSYGLASGMSLSGIINLGYGLSLSIDSNGNLAGIMDNGTSLPMWNTSGNNLYDNKYHFVAMSFDGSYMRLYVDGVMKKEVATVWNNRYSNAGAIGYEGNNSSTCRFWGLIDDIQIYNRSLSTNEIVQYYNANK